MSQPTPVVDEAGNNDGYAAKKTAPPKSDNSAVVVAVAGFFAVVIVALLTALLGVYARDDDVVVKIDASELVLPTAVETPMMMSNVPDNTFYDVETVFSTGENVCAGKNPGAQNVDCVHVEGPQAGANVTKGYKGSFNVTHDPLTSPYWMNKMCPVNVHWHLGTEHYSVGEYDEFGNGPNGNVFGPDGKTSDGVQPGYRCHHYDANDPKFTTPYEWKHCKEMIVGETYEVHWPHSAAGACGTVNQYQTPFYDGVFCTDGVLSETFSQIGVQGQIYTVVNDEAYFYPDMIRGWIVDGEYGSDIHYYTGSTTGQTRSNEVCSVYTPITWQVDRKCHMISASSFDKLCYDMKLQRDDMNYDLYAHGSRELVADWLVASNGQRRRRQLQPLRLEDTYSYHHLHDHDHHHAHSHDDHHHHHAHDHHHHEWF